MSPAHSSNPWKIVFKIAVPRDAVNKAFRSPRRPRVGIRYFTRVEFPTLHKRNAFGNPLQPQFEEQLTLRCSSSLTVCTQNTFFAECGAVSNSCGRATRSLTQMIACPAFAPGACPSCQLLNQHILLGPPRWRPVLQKRKSNHISSDGAPEAQNMANSAKGPSQ